MIYILQRTEITCNTVVGIVTTQYAVLSSLCGSVPIKPVVRVTLGSIVRTPLATLLVPFSYLLGNYSAYPLKRSNTPGPVRLQHRAE